MNKLLLVLLITALALLSGCADKYYLSENGYAITDCSQLKGCEQYKCEAAMIGDAGLWAHNALAEEYYTQCLIKELREQCRPK